VQSGFVLGPGVTTGFIEIVGTLAASLTTAAFFPQVIKTLRTRETSGLSLSMYLLLVTGVALWLLYGLMIGSRPLILENGLVLMPQLAILVLLLQRSWCER
jgi:MtN3 and saliva related transmembrane protein